MFKITIERLPLKMEYTEFTVLLQDHTEDFRCITLYGGSLLKKNLVVIKYFKSNEIDVYSEK